MRVADRSRAYWTAQAAAYAYLGAQFHELGVRPHRDANLRAALKVIAVHGPVGLRHEARELSRRLG